MVSRLEDLCGNKLAITHANRLEYKKKFSSLLVHIGHYNWKFRELFVTDKQLGTLNKEWFKSLLDLASSSIEEFPFGLRKKIPVEVVKFCVLESFEWVAFLMKEFNLSAEYSYYFLRSSFFTSKGMINKENAARELVKDTEISSSIRFCIACYYCFSDVIPVLWEELPEEERPQMVNGIYNHRLGIGGNNENVILWSRFLLNKLQSILEKGETFPLYKFEKCLKNEVSFKNCFEELNELERDKAAIFTRNRLNKILDGTTINLFSTQIFLRLQPYIHIITLLLCRLDENQLKEFFESRKMLYLVLYHLLSWPYQHLFIDTLKRFGEELSNCEFFMLLCMIVISMNNKLACKFCDYYYILKKFWVQSPSSFKRFFFNFEIAMNYDVFVDTLIDGDDAYYLLLFEDEFDFFKESCVIYQLFIYPTFNIKHQEIIRLIFESATLEEKSRIVESQWKLILEISLQICDLNRIDLFIECCIPQESVISFKRQLMDDEDVIRVLWNLILYNKLEQFQMILNWALCGEEIKEFQQKLLHSHLSSRNIVFYSSNELKCINKFLECNLSSDEIKRLKKSLVSSANEIVKYYELLLLEGDFEDIDFYLNWIYSSESEITKLKNDIALVIIRNMNYFKCKDLSYIKKFVKWSAFSQEGCKDF